MVQKQKDFVKLVTTNPQAADKILKEFFQQSQYVELQAMQSYVNAQEMIAFIHAFSGQQIPVPKINQLIQVAEKLGYINTSN